MEPTFWHFSVGNLMEILTVFGGLLTVVFGAGRRMAGIERTASDLKDDFSEIKTDVKKLGEIITQIAVQKERLDMFDKRMDDMIRGRIRLLPTKRDEL